MLHFLQIPADRAGDRCQPHGRHIGVGQAQHDPPRRLGQRDLVAEVRIAIAQIVVVAVIERVIDAAHLALAPIAEVDGRDPQVLDEGGIVRAGAQRGEGHLAALGRDLCFGLGLLPGTGSGALDLGAGPAAGGHRRAGLRVGHVAGHLVDQALQAVAALRPQEAALVGVGIDVGHGLLLQFGGVGFRPFGGADQARLLRVPAGIDQGALRPPAGPGQGADRLGLLHQHHVAGQGIGGPEHPAVMVVAADHPLVGEFLALHHGDDVVDRLQAPVRLDQQMRRGRADPAGPVGDGQGPAEVAGGERAAHGRQEGLGIRIGDGQGRDVQDGRRRLAGQALGVLGGAHARGQRIPGIDHHLLDRAALHPLGRALAALGPDIVGGIAVIGGVGEDQAADSPVFLRQLRLQAPPAGPVAGQHDLALHRDAEVLQGLVVLRHAVVHIDDVGGHIAVPLIGHIGGQGAVGLNGGAVPLHRRFVQGGGEGMRAQQLQLFRDRGRVEDVEGLDPRVPAPGLELGQHQLGIGLVVGGAHMVRLRRQGFQPALHLLAAEGLVELRLQGLLAVGMFRGEAEDRGRRCTGRRQHEARGNAGDQNLAKRHATRTPVDCHRGRLCRIRGERLGPVTPDRPFRGDHDQFSTTLPA